LVAALAGLNTNLNTPTLPPYHEICVMGLEPDSDPDGTAGRSAGEQSENLCNGNADGVCHFRRAAGPPAVGDRVRLGPGWAA
jgi:hypothetical protein